MAEPSNHVQGDSSLVEQQASARKNRLMTEDGRFKGMENHLVELGGLDDTRAELQAAINVTLERLVSENEALKLARAEEVSAVEEDNRVLKEKVEECMRK
ncbi:hypothetical protein GH714_023122 [Hevea brasiliensis]|uniref:Uncharacterized protein n=1 Tax=Hevea brasiliensis TaxID=3981 RepID=A0A6A6KQY0_HEVBR|nr:hypothetical protein GH714_023122 [Hevea brasiliensis]